MKKLKKTALCVFVATAALYTIPALAAEQKFKVPEYELKDVVKRITNSSSLVDLYLIDRNKDGKLDLYEKNFYYETEKGKQLDAKYLFIDDDFDGFMDRILHDAIKEDGSRGADGIYDEEKDLSKYKLPMDKLPYWI